MMHTHTAAGVSVACLEGGMRQTNVYTAQLHDMVAYHDFEGITLRAKEGPRLVQNIGDRRAVILRNHGLLALQFDPKYGGGQDGFDALVRQIDRIDPSYRD